MVIGVPCSDVVFHCKMGTVTTSAAFLFSDLEVCWRPASMPSDLPHRALAHTAPSGILSHPLPYHIVLEPGLLVLTDPSKLPFDISHKDYWMLSLSHIMKNDVGMNNISHLLSAYHVRGTVLSTLHIMFCFVTTP